MDSLFFFFFFSVQHSFIYQLLLLHWITRLLLSLPERKENLRRNWFSNCCLFAFPLHWKHGSSRHVDQILRYICRDRHTSNLFYISGQVAPKCCATTHLPLTRKKWSPLLYRGRTFIIVKSFWSSSTISFVRKNSFRNEFCPSFQHTRYWISSIFNKSDSMLFGNYLSNIHNCIH